MGAKDRHAPAGLRGIECQRSHVHSGSRRSLECLVEHAGDDGWDAADGSVTNQNSAALNFINAEKTFREDKYTSGGANQTTRDAAVGTAQLGYNRGAVDQSSLWQHDSAQGDWWFDWDSSTQDKTDAINEATRYRDNDEAWADYDKNLLLAQIAEDVAEANTLNTAKYQRSVSLANVEASYRGNQFAAELAAWTALDLVLGNAWSDAKRDEASVKQSAWNSVSSQFVTKETNIALAEQSALRTSAMTLLEIGSPKK